MKQILSDKMYNTETASLLADNEFSDGSNRFTCGRATSLYKTKKGSFFAYHETCWQGEHDWIEPLTILEAKDLFEELRGDPQIWVATFGEPEEA